MDKEKFLKDLKYQLRFLTKEAMEEELKKYENIQDYDTKTEDIANEIYQKRGLNIKVKKRTSFLDSVSTIIEEIREKKNIGNILLFFLYSFVLIVFIKIPFIYIRDVVSEMFNILVINSTFNIIWNLLFEILYALTAIFLFIKLIKFKALEYDSNKD